MGSFISLLIFCFVTYFILRIEKKYNGTYFTPYFFLVVPFLIVISINVLLSSSTIFYKVDSYSILLWMLYSLFFWVGSLFFYPITKKRENLTIDKASFFSKLIINIGIVSSILLIIIGINLIAANNIHYFGSDDFSGEYGQGISAYLRIFSIISTIYYIAVVNKSFKYRYITMIIFIVPLLLYQIKGMLLIPIIGGLIFRIYIGNLKISFRFISILLVLIFMSFITLYSLPIVLQTGSFEELDKDFFAKQFEKIFQYLFSGVLGYSYALVNEINFEHLDGNIIISPLWNILRRVTGWDRVESVLTEISFPISENGEYFSNVFTIFGTVNLYWGGLYTSIYSFILGLINYLYKFLAFNNKNIMFKINYFFNLAILAFGWFDYMYNYSYIWILLIITFLLYCIERLLKNKKITFSKKERI